VNQIINKQTVLNQITTFITILTAELNKQQKAVYKNLPELKYEVTYGRKFARVLEVGNGKRVYCFIDLATGGLLKADSFTAPAKGVRGSIFNPNCDVGTVATLNGHGFYRDAQAFIKPDTQPKEEKMVETVNLMSGKKVMIRESEKGGCCDPGTERYWTM
jgi:hypothetical protein